MTNIYVPNEVLIQNPELFENNNGGRGLFGHRDEDPDPRATLVRIKERDADSEHDRQSEIVKANRDTLKEGYGHVSDVAVCDDDDEPINIAHVKPSICLYDETLFPAFERYIRSAPKESRARLSLILEQAQALGHRRALKTLPDDWRERLDTLDERFPNFQNAIAFMRRQFALESLGVGAIKLPPTLLSGPPGIGKTEFANVFCELFELPNPVVIDVSQSQNSAALCGTDAHWSNAEPGMVFSTLMSVDCANPVIFLDELDKAGSSSESHRDCLAPLHTLLEQRSAKVFHDLSIRNKLAIDTSNVIWIAAANDIERVKAPIKSRFISFEIAVPSRADRAVIAQNIFTNILSSNLWGGNFLNYLDQAVVDHIIDSGLPPRRMKQLLFSACGQATWMGRSYLTVDDIAVIASELFSQEIEGPVQRSIGFLSQPLQPRRK